MALVFILAGSVGLIVTLIAMRSRFYALLAKRYNAAADEPDTHPRRPAPTRVRHWKPSAANLSMHQETRLTAGLAVA